MTRWRWEFPPGAAPASEACRMKIAFATAALPDTGTAVVLAADGALGATAADLDRRTGGALRRAIELAGNKLKRGRADRAAVSGGDRARPRRGARRRHAGRGETARSRGARRQPRGQAEGAGRRRGERRGRCDRRAAVRPGGACGLAWPRAPCCAATASTSIAPSKDDDEDAGRGPEADLPPRRAGRGRRPPGAPPRRWSRA